MGSAQRALNFAKLFVNAGRGMGWLDEAEPLLSGTMKGKNKDEFRGAGHAALKAIGSVATGGVSQEDPVGRPVASSLKARAVDQGFQQDWRISIMLAPILRELAGRTSQDRGSQSFHVNGRENEKAAVIDDVL